MIIKTCQLRQLETSPSWFPRPAAATPGPPTLRLRPPSGQGLAHPGVDLLELGVRVDVAVPVLLGVEQLPAHHLHLQPARGVGGALPRHLHLRPELVLKLLLQLAELGGVPSSTAANIFR